MVENTPETKVKKGKPTWQPAQRLSMGKKSKNFRYRWCDSDSQNIEQKRAEGWEFVNGETGIPGEHDHPQGVGDGKPLDSTKTYRELVAMALPEELGEARDEWVNERTRKQTRSIKDVLKEQVTESAKQHKIEPAQVTGKIVIE